MNLTGAIILSFIASIAAGVGGYYAPSQGYWQALLINLATTIFGLGVGLVVINHYLSRREKKMAAIPMLKMIEPSVGELHNEFFIKPGRLKFGIPGFIALIDAYHDNGHTPDALSPEQRNGLYELIKQHRAKSLVLMESIHDQLREMTSLLGWSFSPKIITISMQVRLDIVNFKNLELDDTDKAKLKACELCLDIDAGCGNVLDEIHKLLDHSVEDWHQG